MNKYKYVYTDDNVFSENVTINEFTIEESETQEYSNLNDLLITEESDEEINKEHTDDQIKDNGGKLEDLFINDTKNKNNENMTQEEAYMLLKKIENVLKYLEPIVNALCDTVEADN